MSPNRISVWKVMTIWIFREFSLFNFERLSILCTRIEHLCEKLLTIWISIKLPLLNFKCLDILCAWVGHPSEQLWPLEFLESFCLSILSVSVYYVPDSDIHVKSYDNLNCSRASVVQFCAYRYVMCLNRISVWNVMTIWIFNSLNFLFVLKVMTIWISIELPFFNFKCLDILIA